MKGGVQDPDEFTLTLRVRVPPTTSFLMYYWQSPTVVIDQYMGDFRDKFSPEWLETVQTERRFWQSRPLMLEMMLNFVRNIPLNSKVSTRVGYWCEAMSVSISSELGE
jgi:ribosomal protein L16 Arg81 hydroxylase